MNAKNSIKYMILGWLPKEPSMTYAVKTLKYRWRTPFRVAFATVALIAVISVVYSDIVIHRWTLLQATTRRS